MAIGGPSITGIIQEMDGFQPVTSTRFEPILQSKQELESGIIGHLHGLENYLFQTQSSHLCLLRVE